MKALYINTRFYLVLLIICICFVTAMFIPVFFYIAFGILGVFIVLLTAELFLLFHHKKGITAQRHVPERLSNGDMNDIQIRLNNNYPYKVTLELIDELPFQFQERHFLLKSTLKKYEQKEICYELQPTQRGVYAFGVLNVYATTAINFVSKRYRLAQPIEVPVYPSFLNLRKYELMATRTAMLPNGIKRTRKIGQSSEFEQIKDYVLGDDLRHVNWKASAKKQQLMINHYQEEKAQNVYMLIDKGRTMKMPFDGLSLLDYSINASLMLANISIKRQDKAGLWTFEKKTDLFLKADNKPLQIRRIVDALYHINTNYRESNYEYVLTDSLKKVQKRSLLILFTNFETLDALKRQLPYLRALAKKHVLLIIIFENTLLNTIHSRKINTTKDIYNQTVASKFVHEKQLIVQELQMHGIKTIYTKPADLSVNLLNKYIEIKQQQII